MAEAEHRRCIAPMAEHRRYIGWAHQLPADLLIDWLGASRYLARCDNHIECTKAFAILFARAGLSTANILMSNLEVVGETVLRRARVRLDAVALLWWQTWFGRISLDDINFVIYIDGSPQRRGLELFASSIDIIYAGAEPVWVRRLLLPVVSLSRENLDAISKIVALL